MIDLAVIPVQASPVHIGLTPRLPIRFLTVGLPGHLGRRGGPLIGERVQDVRVVFLCWELGRVVLGRIGQCGWLREVPLVGLAQTVQRLVILTGMENGDGLW